MSVICVGVWFFFRFLFTLVAPFILAFLDHRHLLDQIRLDLLPVPAELPVQSAAASVKEELQLLSHLRTESRQPFQLPAAEQHHDPQYRHYQQKKRKDNAKRDNRQASGKRHKKENHRFRFII
mgnify:CR=1 FL=1